MPTDKINASAQAITTCLSTANPVVPHDTRSVGILILFFDTAVGRQYTDKAAATHHAPGCNARRVSHHARNRERIDRTHSVDALIRKMNGDFSLAGAEWVAADPMLVTHYRVHSGKRIKCHLRRDLRCRRCRVVYPMVENFSVGRL